VHCGFVQLPSVGVFADQVYMRCRKCDRTQKVSSYDFDRFSELVRFLRSEGFEVLSSVPVEVV